MLHITHLAQAQAQRIPSSLLSLPDALLKIILEYCLRTPIQEVVSPVSLLLACATFHRLALPLIYHTGAIDTTLLSPVAIHQLARQLDPQFDFRTGEFLHRRLTPHLLQYTPPLRLSLYPLTPANSFPSAVRRPPWRLLIRSLKITSSWDRTLVGAAGLRNWGGRGIPFGWLPVMLDAVRVAMPNLRSLSLDLAKSIVGTDGSRQQAIDELAADVLECVHRFGLIEVLAVDAWPLQDAHLSALITRCASVAVLTLRRISLSLVMFAPVEFEDSFGLTLRRLTITESTLEMVAIPFLLKTCLSLQSLQLLAHIPDPTQDELAGLVESYGPRGRRFPHGPYPPIAPVQSLVLRLSYRLKISYNPHRLVHLTALLHSLASTLRHLHLSIHLAQSPYLVPLLADGFPRLEKLFIGFLGAVDEVGVGVRLTSADDRRVRTGLVRGDEVLDDRDPVGDESVETDGWATPFDSTRESREARTFGGLPNERQVLARLLLEEGLVRSLVDSTSPNRWPPTDLTSYWRAIDAFRPFPTLADVLVKPRTARLKELHLFETEYAGAVGRQQALVEVEGSGRAGGGAAAGKAWERVMLSSQGYISI